MYAVIEPTERKKPATQKTPTAANRNPRYPRTAEIRALLSDLKLRPRSHREFICKLLKSAAAHSARKVSVVRHATPSHPTKP